MYHISRYDFFGPECSWKIFREKLSELGGNDIPFHDYTMALKGICMRTSVHWRFVDRPYRWRQREQCSEKYWPIILVAPFSTINGIIRHVSLVGKIMGGKLISILVKVSGDMNNLDVLPRPFHRGNENPESSRKYPRAVNWNDFACAGPTNRGIK